MSKKRGPKKRATDADKCVCCGSSTGLEKHHVIPRCIGKFLSERFKHNQKWGEHLQWLCVECHDIYEIEADLLKDTLLKKHDGLLQVHFDTLSNFLLHQLADGVDLDEETKKEFKYLIRWAKYRWKRVVERYNNESHLISQWKNHFKKFIQERKHERTTKSRLAST